MSRLRDIGHALYEGRVSFDFVGRTWTWYTISALILVLAVSGLLVRGLNLGIEFKGGVEYTVSMPSGQADEAHVQSIRNAVAREAGSANIPAADAPIVNTSGRDKIRVQVKPLTNDQSDKIANAIEHGGGVGQRAVSSDAIGASWGSQVANRALLGLGVFLVLVMLFIWAYFREWKMSVGAIVALVHDLLITIGVYALSGFEVTPATVTGVLTILGFSLYDTVVVFDKVRENTKSLRSTRKTYSEAANLAVNQTLVRSINTSIVALIPVGAILYVGAVQLGNGSLKDLALALFVGMAAGTYSSVFIATPLLAHMKQGEKDNRDIERRLASKRRHEADRYASVPVFTEDMAAPDGDEDDEDADGDEHEVAASTQTPARPVPTNRGRVVPQARGPVNPSGAAGRAQPSRQPRSKRGKK